MPKRASQPPSLVAWVLLLGFGSGFPLRWTDRLKEDLCIDPDALEEELAIDIAERAGRNLKHTETNPLFGKVETVQDLVLFFHGQPMRPEEPNKLLQPTCEDARG